MSSVDNQYIYAKRRVDFPYHQLRSDLAGLAVASRFSGTATILSLLSGGDHIVAQRDLYGGVAKFFSEWLPKLGIETTLVDTTDYDQHARAIRPHTKLLYLESPTNPSLRIVDMKKTAALAKAHGLISMMDSTFGTPINQHPAEYGIDLVMHSGTKYLSGHADLTCASSAEVARCSIRLERRARPWATAWIRTRLGC